MNNHELNVLIKKYLNAETSLLEEKQLREFFNNNPVPEAFQEYASMFYFFYEEKQLKSTGEGYLHKRKSLFQTKKKVWIAVISSAAAVVLVLIMFLIDPPSNRTESLARINTDTFENPDEAYHATKKALLLASENLNIAMEELEALANFQIATEIVSE